MESHCDRGPLFPGSSCFPLSPDQKNGDDSRSALLVFLFVGLFVLSCLLPFSLHACWFVSIASPSVAFAVGLSFCRRISLCLFSVCYFVCLRPISLSVHFSFAFPLFSLFTLEFFLACLFLIAFVFHPRCLAALTLVSVLRVGALSSFYLSSRCCHRLQTRGNKDQLNVIFNVLGTPTEEEIEALESNEAKQYIRTFPPKEAHDLAERFSASSRPLISQIHS